MFGQEAGFFERHWGDLASVGGLVISIVGFVITIGTLVRTKRAAQAARDAVVEVRDRQFRVNTVADLAQVLAIIEEIKRLHRMGAWEIVLDRYSALRRLLVSILESAPAIGDEQKTTIVSAIGQFSEMESKVERARSRHIQSHPDLARLNETASRILDDLNRVMISIRQAAN